MRPADRQNFVEVIAALAAAFGKEGTETLYAAYWIGLEDLAISAVRRAVALSIKTEKFMPSPAELRQLAGEMLPQDRAVKAWEVVERAMVHLGAGHTVVFDDPVTQATIRNLWHTWIGLEEAWYKDDEKWIRKEFERVYVSLLRSGVGKSGYQPLVGEYELENRKHPDRVAMAIERGWKQPGVRHIKCSLPPLPLLPQEPASTQKRLANPQAIPVDMEAIGKMPCDE